MDVPTSPSEPNGSDTNLPPFQLPKIQETIQQERKSTRWVLIIFLAAILVGFFGAQLASSLKGPPDPDRIRLSKWQSLILISMLPLAAFFVVLIHELGHVVGGKLAGLKFLFLVVGPMKVTRTAQGLVWEVNKSIALMGGLACCIPSDQKQFIAALKWMIVGGPVASVLLTVACYFASIYVLELPFAPSWMLLISRLLKITTLMSLGISAVTIYPGTSGSMKTDGRQLIELLKSNPYSHRQNLVRLLVGQSLAGIRPSEWDGAVIEELDADYVALSKDGNEESLPEQVIWSSLRAAVAVDRNETEKAHDLIQFNLTHSALYPIFARGTLFLDAAIFEARIRHDADAAEALIQAAPGGMMVEAYLPPAAKAEVCRLRGNVDEAKKLAQEALDKTASALDAGGVVMARENLLDIINAPTANA